MGYKKPRYDAAVYYGGKLMGRCTVSDSEAFAALMEDCGNNAAYVLEKYAYFSTELKTILEKVTAIQTSQNTSKYKNRKGAAIL